MQPFHHSLRAGALLTALALSGCAPHRPVPSPAPPPPARLVLMGTTDTHGWLLSVDYYSGRETAHGLTLLAPLIDSVRAANPGRTLLLDSGDMLQGTALTLTAASDDGAGHPVALAMNALGYDAAAVGNHEFDYGIPRLRGFVEEARFPVLSSNVFRAGTDEHAFQPSVMLERTIDGRPVRVGVTAVTTPGVVLWDAEAIRGKLDFREMVASVQPAVAKLRADGADVVVVLAHSGLEGSGYDTAATHLPPENDAARLAREVPAIDVVFLGHTHREVADTLIGGTLVLQAKNQAGSLAVAELTLVPTSDGGWRVAAKSGSLLHPTEGRSDAGLTRLLAPADARARTYVGRQVGVSTDEWRSRTARVEDTPLLDFVNEVERRATGADLASTAAFTLDARIPRGPVTVAQIAGLYVYDNTLEAVKISGAQLRAYLETSAEYYLPCPDASCERIVNPAVPGYNFDVVSGVDYTLDLTRPVGERVVRLERNGAPVQPTDSFTLALNNYRASGSGGYSMLVGAPVVYDRGESIRDLLIAEVERRDTLSPDDYFRKNWEIVPAKLRQQALAEMAGEDSPGKRLRVVATNDFHGALLPSRPGFAKGRAVGGAAALVAYFDSARAEGGATVLIDAGDVMQGTPLSNLTNGRASVDFYNRAGYSAAALGNHEFDWGIDTLRARVAQARFGWLGANVFVKGTDTLPAWVEPTRMVTLPGCDAGAPACDSVHVGIIGIATEQTPTTTRPSNVTSLTFGDEAAAIDRWVPRLRAEGADFVVVTAHSGGFCDRDDPSRGCHGEIFDVAHRLSTHPDLIVSGHTHSQVNTVVNGIPIVQANANGTRFSVVELSRVSPDSVAVRVEQPTTFTDQVRPDSAEEAAIERFEKEIGPKVNEVLAHLAAPLPREGGEYALGDLIADAQRAATGTQVAIMNNGGIRTALDAGPVRYGDLFRLQPFANTLVTMELSGEQLRATVEHALARGEPDAHFSGLRIRYDPNAPEGSRVISLTLADGTPVVPEGWYTVTVNDFMAEGGDGYAELPQGRKVERTGIVDLDALIAYLRRQPQPVQPPKPDRVTPVR